MSDIEEQSESLLESNATASNRRSPNFWERLRRFVREFLGFIFIQLHKIYNLLNDDARDTQQSRRNSAATEPRTVYVDSLANLINEEEGIEQDDGSPVSVQTADIRSDSVGLTDGSELGRARISGGFQIPTSNGGSMLLLSTTIEPASSPETYIPLQPSLPSTTESSKEIAVSYHYKDTNKRVKAISELISAATRDNPVPVFYAPNYQARISGLNAMKKLRSIYQQAALVIVFLSPKYHKSRFCYNEWRAIKDRFFVGCEDQQRERLLFIKLGDFNADELELVADDFPIDGTKMSNKDLANIIVERWHIVEELSTPTTNM